MWLRVVVSLVLLGLCAARHLRTALMAAPGGVEHRDERRTRSGSTYGLGIMSSIRRITSHNMSHVARLQFSSVSSPGSRRCGDTGGEQEEDKQ